MDARLPAGAPEPVMAALRSHLPLTLLVDLALGRGLRSEEVFAAEPGDASWLGMPNSASA